MAKCHANEHKKAADHHFAANGFCKLSLSWLFSWMDSIARTYACAWATFDAYIGVDWILIAFGNCFNRAYRSTSATCYTVVINYVSHNSNISLLVWFENYLQIYSYFSESKRISPFSAIFYFVINSSMAVNAEVKMWFNAFLTYVLAQLWKKFANFAHI